MQITNAKIVLPALVLFCLAFAPAVLAQEEVDSDGDGLSDRKEAIYATDPDNPDTDSDGYLDGEEVRNGFSPRFGDRARLLEVDSDGDYLNDAWEERLGTGVLDPDSDGDLYLDGTEVAAGYDPLRKGDYRLEKRMEVSLARQELQYFMGPTLMGKFPISGGVAGWPTPVGEFEVEQKVPVKRYRGPGYDLPNTKWNLLFSIRNGLKYWVHGAYWHDNFGNPQSHGCVNVSYANMEPLYWWAQLGTRVIVK